MAEILVIYGESGTGKTTSLRNLNPKESLIINSDEKRLPFPHKEWSEENRNLLYVSNPKTVIKLLDKIAASNKIPKVIVWDTVNHAMINQMMNDRTRKDWDKWLEMAGDVYDALKFAVRMLPKDTIFVAVFHEDGDKVKTVGKMLDEKIKIESMATIVLHSVAEKSGDKTEYYFETQTNGLTTAKSPMGMFNEFRIENDLKKVIETINKYYEE
jgi:hypothetical protein